MQRVGGQERLTSHMYVNLLDLKQEVDLSGSALAGQMEAVTRWDRLVCISKQVISLSVLNKETPPVSFHSGLFSLGHLVFTAVLTSSKPLSKLSTDVFPARRTEQRSRPRWQFTTQQLPTHQRFMQNLLTDISIWEKTKFFQQAFLLGVVIISQMFWTCTHGLSDMGNAKKCDGLRLLRIYQHIWGLSDKSQIVRWNVSRLHLTPLSVLSVRLSSESSVLRTWTLQVLYVIATFPKMTNS